MHPRPLPAKVTIEWQAPEYHHFEKSSNWYWAVGAVGLALAFVAVLMQNFLFVVLVILAASTLMLYGARRPGIATYALTGRGIRIDDRLYPYGHLHSFWVDVEGPRPKVIVQLDHAILPHIILPLTESIDAEEIRDFLLAHLPEEYHADTWADMVGDLIGF